MNTIKDLREGRCALINDHSDEFEEVLQLAFPEYYTVTHANSRKHEFYFRDIDVGRCEIEFDYSWETSLPALTPSQFMSSIWIPKFNDVVLVEGDSGWVEKYFVATDTRGKHIVSTTSNGAFSASTTGFVDEIKEVVTTTVTMAEVAEKFGCDVRHLKVINK